MFVGYRFPPTDAEARRRLLSAISESTKGVGAVHFHIVLGPRTSADDAMRLAGLLKSTGKVPTKSPESVLHIHPMYAEDFLSVYDAQHFHERFQIQSTPSTAASASPHSG
jgi:hypothetical protein